MWSLFLDLPPAETKRGARREKDQRCQPKHSLITFSSSSSTTASEVVNGSRALFLFFPRAFSDWRVFPEKKCYLQTKWGRTAIGITKRWYFTTLYFWHRASHPRYRWCLWDLLYLKKNSWVSSWPTAVRSSQLAHSPFIGGARGGLESFSSANTTVLAAKFN